MIGKVTTGLSIQEFETFRGEHRTSLHTCRLHSCPHATVGFESEELRMEHELSHVRKSLFPCVKPSCDYPPFWTAKALKAHAKKHHDVDIPRKLIRRPESGPGMPLSRPPPTIRQASKSSPSTSEKLLDKSVSPTGPAATTRHLALSKHSSPGAVRTLAVQNLLNDISSLSTSPIPPKIRLSRAEDLQTSHRDHSDEDYELFPFVDDSNALSPSLFSSGSAQNYEAEQDIPECLPEFQPLLASSFNWPTVVLDKIEAAQADALQRSVLTSPDRGS